LRDEAAALGVSHFLSKPLDAEEFLAAIREALSHAPPAVSSPPPNEPEAKRSVTALPKAIEARLETLCAETGAGQVLLVTVGGKLLLATGSQSHPELPRLVAATAASVGYSLHLSDQLDDQEPRVVQFLEGERYDLYWASVDRDHFIIILFDAQIRRGRIGTVWVFAQRAANELKILLARLPKDARPGRPVSQSTPRRKRPGSANSRAEDGQAEAPASDESVPDDSPHPDETIAESPPGVVEPAPQTRRLLG
jgi:predicted regulator of Ras-like GTPase activity (Roadblock/LC7/MglB family)